MHPHLAGETRLPRILRDRHERGLVDLREQLRPSRRQRLTPQRRSFRVRRIPFGQLAHDVELRRVRVRHRDALRAAIRVDDIDDRPVREIHDSRVRDLLERDALVGGDEQLGTESREQLLPRLGAFLIGDVENSPDELCGVSRFALDHEVHARERDDPPFGAVLVDNAILTLKATVSGGIGRTHERRVQALAIVRVNPCVDDARARSRVPLREPEQLTNPIVEGCDVGLDIPGPCAELRCIDRQTIACLARGECRDRGMALGDILHERGGTGKLRHDACELCLRRLGVRIRPRP